MIYIKESELNLNEATLVNIVKVLGGIERHYRVKNAIQVVFVERPSAKGELVWA